MPKASKRIRVRMSEHHTELMDRLLEHTSHASKSGVVRSALAFHTQVMHATENGLRVILEHPGTGDQRPLAVDQDAATDGAGQVDAGLLEIRLARPEFDELNRLAAGAGSHKVSETIRLAIESYAVAVEGSQEGYEPVVLTRAGDPLPLALTGVARDAGQDGRQAPRADLRAEGGLPGDWLWRALPRSLAAEVEQLAAAEGCPPLSLVVDMLRAEVAVRTAALSAGEGRKQRGPFDSFGFAEERHAGADQRRHHHTPPVRGVEHGTEYPLVPASQREGWALVLAQDGEGHAVQQVVTSDAVIPLEEDDLVLEDHSND